MLRDPPQLAVDPVEHPYDVIWARRLLLIDREPEKLEGQLEAVEISTVSVLLAPEFLDDRHQVLDDIDV